MKYKILLLLIPFFAVFFLSSQNANASCTYSNPLYATMTPLDKVALQNCVNMADSACDSSCGSFVTGCDGTKIKARDITSCVSGSPFFPCRYLTNHYQEGYDYTYKDCGGEPVRNKCYGGACVECLSNADCSGGKTCQSNSCACPADKPNWNPSTGQCEGLGPATCPDGTLEGDCSTTNPGKRCVSGSLVADATCNPPPPGACTDTGTSCTDKNGVTYDNKCNYKCDGSIALNYVSDYWCVPSGASAGTCDCQDLYCSLGCSGGACKTSPPPSKACTDTDNGDIYVKGTCTSGTTCTGGCPDACVNEGEVEGTLDEVYCSGGKCADSFPSCPRNYKCSNGACVSACTPIYQCGQWDVCQPNNQQTRTCTIDSCGKTKTETQTCTYQCIPNWQTGPWSACQNNMQTRTVSDSNNCGTTANKPSETQTCTPQGSCPYQTIMVDPGFQQGTYCGQVIDRGDKTVYWDGTGTVILGTVGVDDAGRWTTALGTRFVCCCCGPLGPFDITYLFAPGMNSLNIKIIDNPSYCVSIGYWGTYLTGHVSTTQCDSTPPTTTDNSDALWHNSNVAVALTCTDTGGSGCASTRYCTDTAGTCTPVTNYAGPVTFTSSGYIRYYSVDNAGNTETAMTSNQVKIDTNPPSVFVSASPAEPCTLNPLTDWIDCSATASLACSDSNSGCKPASYAYKLYYTNPLSCSLAKAEYSNMPLTVSNALWVCGYAEDNAGNAAVSSPTKFLVNRTFVIEINAKTLGEIDAPAGTEVKAYLCDSSQYYCNHDAQYMAASSGTVGPGKNFKITFVRELVRGTKYKVGLQTEKGYAETTFIA